MPTSTTQTTAHAHLQPIDPSSVEAFNAALFAYHTPLPYDCPALDRINQMLREAFAPYLLTYSVTLPSIHKDAIIYCTQHDAAYIDEYVYHDSEDLEDEINTDTQRFLHVVGELDLDENPELYKLAHKLFPFTLRDGKFSPLMP